MTDRLPFGNKDLQVSLIEPWSQPDMIKYEPGPLGWRSGKWENANNPKILMGNWVENSFDTERQRLPPPLPCQLSHYFRTTYANDYNKDGRLMRSELCMWKDQHPRAFPGHQPEMDPHYFRTYGQKVMTTTQDSFRNPKEFANWSANLLNLGPAGWRPRRLQPISNMAHCYRTTYGMNFNKDGCPVTESGHTCPVRMTATYPSRQPHVDPFFYQNYNRCFPPLCPEIFRHPSEVVGRSRPLFNLGQGGWRLRSLDPLSHIRCGKL